MPENKGVKSVKLFRSLKRDGPLHVGTAVVLTVIAAGVFGEGYETCEASFKNNDWVKSNPDAYVVKDSSNQLKRAFGLQNFNLKSTREVITTLRKDVDGFDLCVNAEETRLNNILQSLDEVKHP